MHKALREDLEAFGADIIFRRLAVTDAQIDSLGLPTKPPKMKGNAHANSFFGTRTVELEAIKPSDLQAILEHAAENALDMDAFRASEARSAIIRTELVEQVRQMRGAGRESI